MDVNQESAAQSSRRAAATRTRAATRARLLEAALELFASDGLHRVTTHHIAAHAGVASGTFYLHFKDKREIFRELTNAALMALKARIDELATPGEAPLEEEVLGLATALADFALENREFIGILFSGDSDAAAVESDFLDNLTVWAEHGGPRHEWPDDIDRTVRAQVMVGMWARVLKWWAEDTSRVSRERLISTLCAIHLRGTHPSL